VLTCWKQDELGSGALVGAEQQREITGHLGGEVGAGSGVGLEAIGCTTSLEQGAGAAASVQGGGAILGSMHLSGEGLGVSGWCDRGGGMALKTGMGLDVAMVEGKGVAEGKEV
jgi:hypothetical protein